MHYDLIVVGCGHSGHEGAIAAAQLGKKVAIIQRPRESKCGVCLPSGNSQAKTLRGTRIKLTSPKSLEDVRQAVSRQAQRDSTALADQLIHHDVSIFHGTAHFESPHRIEISGPNDSASIEGERILLDVGTRPTRSQQFDFDLRSVFDTSDMLSVDHVPKTLAIIGVSVIGIEYGLLFAALGTDVTIVDADDQLFESWDRELTDSVMSRAQSQGLTFQLGDELIGVTRNSKGRPALLCESGCNLSTDAVLFNNNHIGATGELNVAAAGLETDEHARLWCNENYQTWIEHIYAVGDVVGYPNLSHASIGQGQRAIRAAFAEPHSDTESTAYALPTTPEIAMVGQTEQQLIFAGIPYAVGAARSQRDTDAMHSQGTIRLLKLLFHRESHELLGVHCLGDSAREIIQIGQTAMAFGGTIDYFHKTFFNYPTAAQCYKLAALDGLNQLRATRDVADPPASHQVSGTGLGSVGSRGLRSPTDDFNRHVFNPHVIESSDAPRLLYRF